MSGVLDIEMADQLGRELAWVWAQNQGMVTPQMAKEAGLLEGFIYAPLSALAALFSAPWGSKWRSAGLGLLLGAGIASTTGREIEQREARGEKVKAKEISPLLKAVLGGLSIGGGARVVKSIREGEDVGTGASILAAAPLGALLHSSDPAVGALIAGEGAAVLSALRSRKLSKDDEGAAKREIGKSTSGIADVLDDLGGNKLPTTSVGGVVMAARPGVLTSEDISRIIAGGSPKDTDRESSQGRLLPATPDLLA